MESYTSDSSDSDSSSEKVLDFSFMSLEPEVVDHNLNVLLDGGNKPTVIESFILHHNRLCVVPENLIKFSNLKMLDISNNNLKSLPDIFEHCPLTHLLAKNNQLTDSSLPKSFSSSPLLKELNLSGNQLTEFPEQLIVFNNLKYLYLGGNQITSISKNIWKLTQLQVLSLGGNCLTEVPATVGKLEMLQALVLFDNMIESLPSNIANLAHLKSLLLHKNRLKTLPPEIVTLTNLTELSLRDNPLVVQFVSDMMLNPASLLELAARAIKTNDVPISSNTLPDRLFRYLNSAHHCVNPKCKGVYFDNRIEHIKFVDFCGKYRIPLLEYLCSSKCITGKDHTVRFGSTYMMKKVLLG